MSVKVELAETTDSFAKLEKLKLKTEAKLKSMPGIDANSYPKNTACVIGLELKF